MKIQKVKIKNFKKLRNLEKEINGSNIILFGENGVGKSTFMQFIEIALGNQNNVPPNAEGEGEVIVNKDGKEFKFSLRFKDGKPVITVTTPEGAKDTRKGFISQIVGAIDFDVDEFVGLSDSTAGRKKQVELYKSLLDKETIAELDALRVNIQKHYDDRTEINRKADTLMGFIKESKLFGEDLKIEKIDVTAVQEQISAANKHNEAVAKVENGIEARKVNGQRLADEKKRLLDRVAEIETEYNTISKEITDGDKWLENNKRVDTAPLAEQISTASDHNAKYVEAQQLIQKQAEHKSLLEKAGEFTAFIDSAKSEVERFIKEMAVPVDGLCFDDDGLVYNGIPVNTASLSTSEIIHLGCKLKMAQNKDFGVLLIEHGESLGSARLKEIQQLAKDNDWQIILEQVERGTNELQIEIMADLTTEAAA